MSSPAPLGETASHRPPTACREAGASVLLAEVRAPELLRLHRREPWCGERLHDLVGQLPLIGRKARRVVPAQTSSDVVMHLRPRASDLVGAPIQLPYLLEQRLEHVVIDRQQTATLPAAERNPDQPAEVDTAGGRFFGRPPEDGSARRSTSTLTHSSQVRRPPAPRFVRSAPRALATRAPGTRRPSGRKTRVEAVAIATTTVAASRAPQRPHPQAFAVLLEAPAGCGPNSDERERSRGSSCSHA